MSRMPPGPRLISRSPSAPRRRPSSVRAFIARTARRSSATNGAPTAARRPLARSASPRSPSPATGRALSSAWRSHGCGPPVPVGVVAVERPDERPGPALGPQVGVDRKARPAMASTRRAARSSRSGVRRPTNTTSTSDGVVQLVAAELPHPDDGECLGAGEDRPRRRARRASRRCRDRRLEAVLAEQVTGGDPQELPLLPGDERIDARSPSTGVLSSSDSRPSTARPSVNSAGVRSGHDASTATSARAHRGVVLRAGRRDPGCWLAQPGQSGPDPRRLGRRDGERLEAGQRG